MNLGARQTIARLFFAAGLLVSIPSCGRIDDEGVPDAAVAPSADPTYSSVDGTRPEDTPPSGVLVPKLLYHGGGGGAPQMVVNMQSAADQLARLGFPSEHVYLITYPDNKDIADMDAAVRPQLERIFAKYPAETQFDLMGHSLGHIVSLVTFANLGQLPRVRKIVGLAGVIFGQRAKPALCKIGIVSGFLCGDIFDHLVGTGQPPFVLDLIKSHQVEMDRIQKCSLFSPQDGMLDPYDSGAFPEGINVSIPNVSHLKFKSDPLVFSTLAERCYGGNIKQ